MNARYVNMVEIYKEEFVEHLLNFIYICVMFYWKRKSCS